MEREHPYTIYPSLAGLAVFITGGGSGIGASLVEHFSAQGSNVSFVDIAEEPSRVLVEKISARGCPAPVFYACDLRDVDSLKEAIAQVSARRGPIQVLVNKSSNTVWPGYRDV